jgi:hypothetical protein
MLWLIWSDSIRPKRPMRMTYAIRAFLFCGLIGVMIYNLIVYPHLYRGGTKTLVIFACCVGLLGIAYFVKQLTKRGTRP